MTEEVNTKVKPVTLNEKEVLVLRVLAAGGPRTIRETAEEAFPGAEESKASSWVRNSLRKLVRGNLVDKPQRGVYTITGNGQSYVSR